MKCYVCVAEGVQTDAVGICPNCGAALCARHRSQLPVGPGGTAIGCRHRTPGDPRRSG